MMSICYEYHFPHLPIDSAILATPLQPNHTIFDYYCYYLHNISIDSILTNILYTRTQRQLFQDNTFIITDTWGKQKAMSLLQQVVC